MKGLTRAALEKVWRMEQECRGLRASEALVGLGLQPIAVDIMLSVLVGKPGYEHEVKWMLSAFVLKLRDLKDKNCALVRHIESITKKGGAGEAASFTAIVDPFQDIRADYLQAIAEAKEFKPLIAKLRAQVSAMEYDWTQAQHIRDELFDYEAKLREHQWVADELHLKRVPLSSEVKVFATSKRHMIEVLVEDRNRNMNGHFARHVIPLERLRIDKDVEIMELRRTIRKLELNTGTSSAQVEQVIVDGLNAEMVELESRRDNVLLVIEESETKVKSLDVTIRNFEDRVKDWKMAHEQAVGIISKADHLRSEYEGMMNTLREEDARVVAKKKEFERLQAKCGGAASSRGNPEAKFERLRAISEEMDRVEEEIAGKEHALQQLKVKLAGKTRMLETETISLRLMEEKIQNAQREKLEAEGVDEDMVFHFIHAFAGNTFV